MGSSVLLLTVGIWGTALGQSYQHEVRGFPDEAVEGKPLTFTVVYRVPEPVQLHAELKDPSNVVHAGAVETVSGSGSVQFRISVPEGKFAGQLLLAVWMGEDWRAPKGSIRHYGPIPVYTAEEGRRLEEAARHGETLRRKLGLDPRRPVVAVVSGGWAGRDAALAEKYRRALQKAGRRCVLLGPEELTTPGVLDARAIRLLVIPQADLFVGEALPLLERYLKQGGHLIALGAPAFDRLVRKVDGPGGSEWLDDRQLQDRLRQTPATRTLLHMDRLTEADWRRSTNDASAPTTYTMEDIGGETGRAVRHDIAQLSGWDTISAQLDQPAAEGDNLIVFRARGGGNTSALAVELVERDRSRWIAVVPLTARWQRYAVPAGEFNLWDPDRTSGRGAHGDRVNLQAITEVSVGLAFTHTSVPGGRHTYWFADLGSAKWPEVRPFRVPILDTISPEYKLYPVRDARALDASASRPWIAAPAPALPREILSTHPRPTGTGYRKERKYRWIPLLQVVGPQGVAGTVATLVHHLSGPYAGGRWASFTAAGPSWYARPDTVRYVSALADRMLSPVLFAEAGAQYYGYFPDEKPLLGARVVGAGGRKLSARFLVRTAGAGGRVLWDRTVALTRQGAEALAEVRWSPARLTEARYRVQVSLLEGKTVLDELSHEITVRQPLERASWRPRSWIGIERGQFSLDGKPWYPHGVNYMPSSGIAAEDGHYFEQWLSSESYDPAVIDRDLRRIREAGMNMVSVFIYTESTHNRNLVDLLNRCDRYGLRVNLSLRPGTPMDFEWPAMGEIITVNRLAEDPTVFAYDLAWEPMWGYRDQRRRWDGEWAEWLRRQYGSVEAAEAELGEKIPREDGKTAGPSNQDVMEGSRIPSVVAAYRRFQDDLLSRKHMEARQQIRSVDRRHLLSFRMSHAGDPTCGPAIMPYDFMGLARSMDFMSPEGYGRIGDRERVRPGWFTAAYARMCAPGKPVFWAEFGYTIWSKGQAPEVEPGLSFADAFDRRHYLPGTIRFTEEFYRAFYDMTLESGASGTACWWYPGGFRVGENSDFGIINPDGTWRGLTRIIAEYAKRFASRPLPPEPDAWILVDRDRHPDGLYGVYKEAGPEFWRLVAAGKFPGLRTEGTGTDSATCPLTAVGNLPYRGKGPLKYLNGEFERVEILDASGVWVSVPYEGATVRVKPREMVRVRILAGNNGIAHWTAGEALGAVQFVAQSSMGQVTAPLLEPVPSLGTAQEVEMALPAVQGAVDYEFTFEAKGRCRFGEKRPVRLEAAVP